MPRLSDEDVFGGDVAAPTKLSDDDVFGTAPSARLSDADVFAKPAPASEIQRSQPAQANVRAVENRMKPIEPAPSTTEVAAASEPARMTLKDGRRPVNTPASFPEDQGVTPKRMPIGIQPKYETALTPEEETGFSKWKQQYAPQDSGVDYDWRGAFKAKLTPDAKSGHWPDTYKKPNHPTFSVESQYAKDAPELAGRWEGERYVPAGSPPTEAELTTAQEPARFQSMKGGRMSMRPNEGPAPTIDNQFEKGVKAGTIGAKQIGTAAATIPALGAAMTLSNELKYYDQIERGEITKQPLGSDYVTGKARMYFHSSPEMRATMRKQTEDRLTGSEELRATLVDAWKKYNEELKQVEGRTGNFTDIRDLGNFGDWFAWNFGQGIPYMGAAALSAIIGGAVGGPAGAAVGLGGAGYVMGVGDIQSGLMEKGVMDRPELALVGGVPYAALEFLGPVGRAFRQIGRPALEQAAKTYFQKLGREVGMNAVEEFLNEAGQEIVKDAAVTTATGEPLLTEANLLNWVNAGMAGAAAGAPMGAVSAMGGPEAQGTPAGQPAAAQASAGAAAAPGAPPQPAGPPPGSRAELEAMLADERTAEELASAEQDAERARVDAERKAAEQQAAAETARREAVNAAMQDEEAQVSAHFGIPAKGESVIARWASGEEEQGSIEALYRLGDTWAATLRSGENEHQISGRDVELRRPTAGEGTREAPIAVVHAEDVRQAGAVVDPAPTEAQKLAGNYQKGHINLQGLDISIENPAGSTRSGVDSDGEKWAVKMPFTYGYVKRTTGADGDQVDVYVGPHVDAPHVFIVDQVDLGTGKFDEHKAMLGFPSLAAAKSAYMQGFNDGRGADRVGAITPMLMKEFKGWLRTGDTKLAVAYDEKPAVTSRGRAMDELYQTIGETDGAERQVPAAGPAAAAGSRDGREDQQRAQERHAQESAAAEAYAAIEPVGERGGGGAADAGGSEAPAQAVPEKGQLPADQVVVDGKPIGQLSTKRLKELVAKTRTKKVRDAADAELDRRAAAAPAQRAQAKRTEVKDSPLLTAIVRAGGIDRQYLMDVTGGDDPFFPGIGKLFRNGGRGLDELAKEVMVEEHFLTQRDIDDRNDNGGVNKLTEMIKDELRNRGSVIRLGDEEAEFNRRAQAELDRLPAEEQADINTMVEDANAPADWATLSEEQKDAHLESLFGTEPAGQGVGEEAAAPEVRPAEPTEAEVAAVAAKYSKPKSYTDIDPAQPIPDPTNDKPITQAPDETLVCLACSDTKKFEDRKTEGDPWTEQWINIYDGPMWQTLRTHMGEIDAGQVLVLSGKHRWTTGNTQGRPYDERISREKVDELIALGLEGQRTVHITHTRGQVSKHASPGQLTYSITDHGKKPFKNVIIAGGDVYRRGFHAIVTQMVESGVVAPDAAIRTTTGGIGEQRKQLGQWLQEVNKPALQLEAQTEATIAAKEEQAATGKVEEQTAQVRDRNEMILSAPEGTAPATEIKEEDRTPTSQDGFKFSDGGATAGWTQRRVDHLLRKYGVDFKPTYSKAWATMMSPQDFLDLASTRLAQEVVEKETGPLDEKRLSNEEQTPFLVVTWTREKTPDGVALGAGKLTVVQHEGRHRMVALRNAGVTSVPVVLVDDTMEPKPTLRAQSAYAVRRPYSMEREREPEITEVKLDVAIPVSFENRQKLLDLGGKQPTIKFSTGLDAGTFSHDAEGRPLLAGQMSQLVEPTDNGLDVGVKNGKVYQHKIVSGDRVLGSVTLLWDGEPGAHGKVRELWNIIVLKKLRGLGIAEDVVRAILTHNGEKELHAVQILPKARRFWENMGTEFVEHDQGHDGFLTLQKYDDAAAARADQKASGDRAGEAGRAPAQPEGEARRSDAPVEARDQALSLDFTKVKFSAPAPAPIFYSALSKAISDIPQGIAPAEQWKTLIANKQGLKKDEIEWSGVMDWLDMQAGRVKKDVLLEFLSESGLHVSDKHLGGAANVNFSFGEWKDDEPDAQFLRDQAQEHLDEAKEKLARLQGIEVAAVDEKEAQEAAYEMAFNGYAADPERQQMKEIEADVNGTAYKFVATMTHDEFDLTAVANQGNELDQYGGESLWASSYSDSQRRRAPDDPRIERIIRDYLNTKLGIDTNDEGAPFEQYTLPGGKDYGVLLITAPKLQPKTLMPRKLTALPAGYELIHSGSPLRTGEEWGVIPVNQGHARPLTRGQPTQEEAIDATLKLLNYEAEARWYDSRPRFTSSHFDEENILAHVRFKTRADSDGKKVLFVEEFQSDWAERGREKGFIDPADEAKFEKLKLERDSIIVKKSAIPSFDNASTGAVNEEYARLTKREMELLDEMNAISDRKRGGFQPAPFVTKTESWVALSMKRMIRWAADNGFDRVAWTTGDQQNERYNLAKHITAVEYAPTSNDLRFYRPGSSAYHSEHVSPDKIADWIGAEAAKKLNDRIEEYKAAIGAVGGFTTRQIKAGEKYKNRNDHEIEIAVDDDNIYAVFDARGRLFSMADNSAEAEHEAQRIRDRTIQLPRLDGLDLEVGGTAMREFYDKMVVNIANDVLKKLGGGRVDKVATWVGSDHTRGKVGDYTTQPGFDITPELKERVLKGQPLFAAGTMFADRSPEERARIADELRKIAQTIVPQASFELHPIITGDVGRGQQEMAGMAFRNLIAVSLRFKDPKHVLKHEAVHWLKAQGFFTDAEWTALEKAASERWVDQYQIKSRYPGLDEKAQLEEAIADAFASYRAGEKPGGLIGRAFAKLKELLTKIADYLRGIGVNTVEDVFSRAASGQLARRHVDTERGGVNFMAAPKPTENSEGKRIARSKTSLANFRRWFGESKVVDEDGRPLVVYHGTTADFTSFDTARANVESDWGSGIYFTNTKEDVEHNYAGMGPDLTQKVELLAERLASNYEYDDEVKGKIDAKAAELGIDVEGNDAAVKALAKEQLGVVHRGATMPVYLSMENPFILGGDGETALTYELEYEPLDSFDDSDIAELREQDMSDDEIRRELSDRNSYEPTERGSLVDMIESLRHSASRFDGVDEGQLAETLAGIKEFGYDGGIKASKLIDMLRGESKVSRSGLDRPRETGLSYATDEKGDSATHEIIRQALEHAGFDGVIDRTVDVKFGSQKRIGKAMKGMSYDTVHYIAFQPQQVKSVWNNGKFSKTDADVRYAVGAPPTQQQVQTSGRVKKWLAAFLTKNRHLTPWQRTVGTKYNTALDLAKQGKPEFKKVFDLGQEYLADVSAIALHAEAQAPRIFRTIKGLFQGSGVRKATQADLTKVGTALYEGTLHGGGSPMQGKVWTDPELTAKGFDAEQIVIYREARATVDQSLEDIGKSMLAKQAQIAHVGYDRQLDLRLMARDILQNLQLRKQLLPGLIRATSNPLDAARLKAELNTLRETEKNITTIVTKTELLKDRGYFPLMRFGDYTLTITDPLAGNKAIFFGKFESATERNLMAAELRRDPAYQTMRITTGIVSNEEYKLYAGLNLDALELFAQFAQMAGAEPYQDYLKTATASRSALKRLIHRKGTAGYDVDVQRTLAQFITANARHASGLYHLGEMRKAADAIPKGMGDVKDDAIKLFNYVTETGEEAAWLRGYLFFHYLGGTVASALVNMTQPLMMSAPYLAQHTSAPNALRLLTSASRQAFLDPANVQGPLGLALRRAEDEGVTAPQEIYQLTAIASNRLFASHPKVNLAMKAWGIFFSTAEVFNRRTTFIAAYNIARQNGRTPAESYDFAAEAVKATQGIYNKGNRPNWARGRVGATVFTFKQYSIMYLELFKRLPMKQKLMMIAILWLAAGLEGMPFYEDITDLLDTLLQWMGYAVSIKSAIGQNVEEYATKFMGDKVGPIAAKWALEGVSAVTPIDLKSRLGLHNLIPGTSVLKPSEINKVRDVAEFVGPLGGLIMQIGDALELAAKGLIFQSVQAAAMRGVQAATKGGQMLATGEARDKTGKKIDDVTVAEGLWRLMGFNPKRLAEEGEAMREVSEMTNLQRVNEERIVQAMLQAIKANDEKGMEAALADLEKWNARNPNVPINITQQQLLQRAKQLETSRKERMIRSTPPELRDRAAERLNKKETGK